MLVLKFNLKKKKMYTIEKRGGSGDRRYTGARVKVDSHGAWLSTISAPWDWPGAVHRGAARFFPTKSRRTPTNNIIIT